MVFYVLQPYISEVNSYSCRSDTTSPSRPAVGRLATSYNNRYKKGYTQNKYNKSLVQGRYTDIYAHVLSSNQNVARTLFNGFATADHRASSRCL